MKRLAFCLLALFLAFSPAFAQSSDTQYQSEWRMFRRNLNHTAFSESSAPSNNNQMWSYYVGGTVRSSAAIVDGIVYAGGAQFYALNATNGSKIWNYSVDASVSSPAVADDRVYFGGGYTTFKVYALNASTGSSLWNYSTGGNVVSSPAVEGGVVYIGSSDHNLYALNATNGSKIWNYSTGGDVESSPAVVDGVVYFGSYQGKTVYALNASTSDLIWNHSFDGSSDYVYASPAVAYGRVYVNVFDRKMFCLNATDGSELWNRTIGYSYSSPAVDNGVVYIGFASKLYALDAYNGSINWMYNSTNEIRSAPSLAGGLVFLVDTFNHRVHALNATNGTEAWNAYIGTISYSSPAIADGVVYLGGGDSGKFYAFGSVPLWDSGLLGQLNVSQTCGSEINATALNFGSLVPGQTSAQQSLLLSNIGSWNTSDITLEGTDWIANATVTFTANYSKWSDVTGFAYASGTSILNTPDTLGFSLANNETKNLFFRVQIPLGQATATYTQNLTLTTLC